MRSLFHNQTISLARIFAFIGAGLLLVTLFTSVLSVSALGEASATGNRLITVHDRGQDRGIMTNATTLRAAFDEAGIALDKNDLVEPGIDEQLVANNYEVNIYRARPVMVIDGPVRQKVMTPYQTANQIAQTAGIELHDEDTTTITRSEDIVSDGSGLLLTIDRATPFTLVLYGKKVTAYTQVSTVGAMLSSKNISLGKDDTLSVAASTPITAGMSVEIWRNGKQTVTDEQPIAFETEKIQDADRPVGYKEVKTPGQNGKKNVTYEVEMRNGIEVGRVEIQSVTTQESKKQVEVVGAKLPTPTNPSEAQALGHQMMLAYGFGEDQWPCLYNLWMRESGWKTTAHNASGAHGIPQALPGSKMGTGWESDAAVQIQWGLGYVKGRYGTPCGAWASFQSKGWY